MSVSHQYWRLIILLFLFCFLFNEKGKFCFVDPLGSSGGNCLGFPNRRSIKKKWLTIWTSKRCWKRPSRKAARRTTNGRATIERRATEDRISVAEVAAEARVASTGVRGPGAANAGTGPEEAGRGRGSTDAAGLRERAARENREHPLLRRSLDRQARLTGMPGRCFAISSLSVSALATWRSFSRRSEKCAR